MMGTPLGRATLCIHPYHTNNPVSMQHSEWTIPHNNIPSGAGSKSIQVDYPSKNKPKPTKPTKENILNSTSKLTMEKMIHKPPILFAYTIPINHHEALLPKIVHCTDLSWGHRPSKKVTLNGTLVCQILFQGNQKPSLQVMTL